MVEAEVHSGGERDVTLNQCYRFVINPGILLCISRVIFQTSPLPSR